VEVAGIPASVDRARVCELVEGLGIDPAQLITLTVHLRSIEATVYAVNERGSRYAADGSPEPATHTLSIEIT
jgi:hypothetical protein